MTRNHIFEYDTSLMTPKFVLCVESICKCVQVLHSCCVRFLLVPNIFYEPIGIDHTLSDEIGGTYFIRFRTRSWRVYKKLDRNALSLSLSQDSVHSTTVEFKSFSFSFLQFQSNSNFNLRVKKLKVATQETLHGHFSSQTTKG